MAEKNIEKLVSAYVEMCEEINKFYSICNEQFSQIINEYPDMKERWEAFARQKAFAAKDGKEFGADMINPMQEEQKVLKPNPGKKEDARKR